MGTAGATVCRTATSAIAVAARTSHNLALAHTLIYEMLSLPPRYDGSSSTQADMLESIT